MGAAGLRFFREQVERAAGRQRGETHEERIKDKHLHRDGSGCFLFAPGALAQGGPAARSGGGLPPRRGGGPDGERSAAGAGAGRDGYRNKKPAGCGGADGGMKTGSCGGFGRGGGRSGLGGDIEIRPAGVDGAQQQRGGNGGYQNQQDDRGKVRRGQKPG